MAMMVLRFIAYDARFSLALALMGAGERPLTVPCRGNRSERGHLRAASSPCATAQRCGRCAAEHPCRMRQLLPILAVLLAFVPACTVENGTDDGETDGRTRGERCDDMQLCGRMECGVEAQATASCFADSVCGSDAAQLAGLRSAWVECLESNGCSEVSCDLVSAVENPDEFGRIDFEAYCDSPDDAEIATLALEAQVNGDVIADCQALE